MPISKEDSLTHQSGNPWRQSEDHSRIQITWPCRSWDWYFHSGFFPRFILRVSTPFQSVLKALSISILLGQLNRSIQGTIQSTCMYLAQLCQFNLPLWEFKHTVKFQDGQSCIGPIQTIQPGLPSRILEQLASHPSRTDSLQDLMHITIEIDTRYHERKKEKNQYQEKKHESPRSSTSHPQKFSSSSHKKKKNLQKREKPHSSLLNKEFKLMNSEKERRIKEGLCT
ncbi:hypothetical protein O181_107102 [Austropuccinia psidii MF-1]|uniref:Uncharacterized protein n=1 Tax=Austropuccinia psidii MF-1 TaxID=1389203 RepID=A0A9Q3JRM3_9BASI|nr:hypothetical protein [Austropuccinia psidii MF-1]